MRRWLVLAFGLLGPAAQAHVASNGFVAAQVSGRSVSGSVEIAVRDVELAVGVDASRDGKVTWGELRAAERRIDDYLVQHLVLKAQGRPCPFTVQGMQVNDRVDGTYVWLPFSATCSGEVSRLEIQYFLLRDVDPSHRALLALKDGPYAQTAVLGGPGPAQVIAVRSPLRWPAFTQYLQAGIWHIWSGIDHLLFLLSLLLPAVLLRRGGLWEPVPRVRPALLSILKVVTAFTLAHSITLTLAALGIIRLPTRLTESVIAASIILAALNNIFPIVIESRARIAFAFGLLHGFGFASVLADMGLPQGARVLSLLAFNLGIEGGQLAVVVALMPLAYLMRSTRFYRRALLPLGSAAVALLAFVWLVQRALLPTG